MAAKTFETVPELWKWPAGPYKQAPADFGGQWWYTSPFTGEEPWKTQLGQAGTTDPDLPQGFEEIFGPKPTHVQYPDIAIRTQMLNRWLEDLKYFKGAGKPEGFSDSQIQTANVVYQKWGLGGVKFFEGRYGWLCTFPEADVDFRTDVFTAIESPQNVVADWQLKRLQMGEQIPVAELHPYVRPDLFQ